MFYSELWLCVVCSLGFRVHGFLFGSEVAAWCAVCVITYHECLDVNQGSSPDVSSTHFSNINQETEPIQIEDWTLTRKCMIKDTRILFHERRVLVGVFDGACRIVNEQTLVKRGAATARHGASRRVSPNAKLNDPKPRISARETGRRRQSTTRLQNDTARVFSHRSQA